MQGELGKNSSNGLPDTAAPPVGTLRYLESPDAIRFPYQHQGPRLRIASTLIRGWRVLMRPTGLSGKMGGGYTPESMSQGETPVGTRASEAISVLKYQPSLYSQPSIQNYRIRRRKEEHLGRLVLGVLVFALVGSLAVIGFVRPMDRKQSDVTTVVQASKAATTVVAPAIRRTAPKLGPPTTYKIRKGDTISQIANRHGIPAGDLAARNGLNLTSVVRIGQELKLSISPKLPHRAPVTPNLATGRETRRTEGLTSRPLGARQYQVRKGDIPERIALRFRLKPATLFAANRLTKDAVLRPGQLLRIPPANGFYHTVGPSETLPSLLKRYRIKAADFRRFNSGLGERLAIKDVVFVPQDVSRAARSQKNRRVMASRTEEPRAGRAKNERAPSKIQYRSRDGQKRAHRGIWGDLGRVLSRDFRWPLRSFQVSSGFGYRRRDWHPGLDIRASKGAPIRAARAGVVVRSGWESGYGRMVEIDHGDGVVTRYAHASKLHVHKGERVEAGTVIAAVGSTGRSTGPHLHYEVRVKGRPVNPTHVH